MHSVKTTFLAASAAALVTLPALAADLTIVFKETRDGKESTLTEYFTTNKMRTTGERGDMIIDTGAGRMTMIDTAKKEYSEVTVAELQEAMKGAGDQMAALRAKQAEAMKNMPAAQREQMAKLMGGAMGAGGVLAVKVTPGEGTRKVAGYDTHQYIMTMGESTRTEMWTTTALQLPLQPGELLRMQQMMSPMAKEMGSAIEEFKKIQGFTLASNTTVKILTKTMQSSREATEIKAGAIPAATFEVPAGYTKVPSPLLRTGKH